jgi:hypothetical protein
MQRQSEKNLSAVHSVARVSNQSSFFQAVAEFNRAVLLHLKPLGQKADRGPASRRFGLDYQECLVLLWLDARFARRPLAEVQETPDS